VTANKDLPAFEDDEADTSGDFADEHTPSQSDPPIAPADAPGGEAEGYQPQTRTPEQGD
jgi:hypothetical protein